MGDKWEVRLSGTGGQGLILGGIILAEAGILDGYKAVQSQSYGPEARGGASKAEVIISTREINYPKIGEADILLAMSQQAYDKYATDLREGGILIIDSTLVTNIGANKAAHIYRIPITEIAKKETGLGMTANIVALGAIVGVTKVVTEEALKEAVLDRIPAGTEEINLRAVQAGLTVSRTLVI
ncbi:2-oxoglutarate ferredoxin oxidoreductase subunit gamma [Candidatus Formimonas warabiya]|uniref:2-oxoglutarate ferredoxin oxidoreductase subunit gamma n=2 Tax=Formimonas warabiya TaxID=1761012 RepID=A0A3G1L2E6_FORW1|nr:2-oxoacid:acceptor oxidoreductase family protein [Candidatus Formimonas warabiya]ATW28831.1 2-oxoglutarate ferredoxin oxidoreductase subunit gamma [Candidatus Formimonas warabiya]